MSPYSHWTDPHQWPIWFRSYCFLSSFYDSIRVRFERITFKERIPNRSSNVKWFRLNPLPILLDDLLHIQLLSPFHQSIHHTQCELSIVSDLPRSHLVWASPWHRHRKCHCGLIYHLLWKLQIGAHCVTQEGTQDAALGTVQWVSIKFERWLH